jgi:hypothetical protein
VSSKAWISPPHGRRPVRGGPGGAGLRAVFFGEEDVVVLTGVEGRIEVDEVDGFVLDVELEDFEVVAVVELVLLGGHLFGMRVAQCGSAGASRSL